MEHFSRRSKGTISVLSMIEEVRIESKKTKTFIFMDFAVYLLHLEGSLTPSSKGLILHIT